MSHWNYRVIHRKIVSKNTNYEEDVFAIHEVYYNNVGDIISFSVEPSPVWAETPEGLKWVLTKFEEAYNKPILRYEDLINQIRNPNHETFGITHDGE